MPSTAEYTAKINDINKKYIDRQDKINKKYIESVDKINKKGAQKLLKLEKDLHKSVQTIVICGLSVCLLWTFYPRILWEGMVFIPKNLIRLIWWLGSQKFLSFEKNI